ncbi:hypothetical protein PM082_014711 [Marasmius tenuissimus]|nr:hypothetical protein PM082_014711 [Marasmius tenuissimus]
MTMEIGPQDSAQPQLSNPSSFRVATDSDTSGLDNSEAKIIGGSVGGVFFLSVLVATILFLHNRRAGRRVRELDKEAAVIHPFPPASLVSDSSRERDEPPSIPASNREVAEVSNYRVTEPTGGERSINLRLPETERRGGDPSHQDDNRPVDQASYRALQAQVQLLMQRLERVEAVEEAPPEYVSARRSSR